MILLNTSILPSTSYKHYGLSLKSHTVIYAYDQSLYLLVSSCSVKDLKVSYIIQLYFVATDTYMAYIHHTYILYVWKFYGILIAINSVS